jgi:putative DNA methylase
MAYKKKLIEVALPLEAINAESSREKSIRHGHPSTLHLWWARRPLAAARAVIFSSLVDDPSSHPEKFPTEKEQEAERKRLFALIEKLVKWENSNNEEILNQAKAEIMKSTDGNPPALLDPFAGGGSIPLEAQRLGLEAHASDLNPVAVMINKAMIEIPPKFAGQPPVNPVSRVSRIKGSWRGAEGLAEDVRYYGEWMKQEAFKRIGHLYPKVRVPKEQGGGEATVIAWIWARTVKCPNPACGCEMPLASSFELSKKKGKEAYIQPIIEGKNIRYEVKYGKNAPEPPKTARGKFKCICCGEPVQGDYIKAEGKAKRIGTALMAIIAESKSGRLYITPSIEQVNVSLCPLPDFIPDGELNGKAADQLPLYGYTTFSELYTNRQLTALTTFSSLVAEARAQVERDGGSTEYARAVGVYLAFSVDKLTDTNSKCVSWNITRDGLRNTFARQAIAMTWDFAEGNPLGDSSGCFSNALDWIERSIAGLPAKSTGFAVQHEAQTDNGLRNIMVSTDPPYYDNICYADLSDYFYVWLRRALNSVYPDLFRTIQVPKTAELIASPYRFNNGFKEAKEFFESGMLQAFRQINTYACPDAPVTVYYAFKESDGDDNGDTASSGWETMLNAIVQAGFSITGTWPMRTEREVRTIASGTNALASSIVLVCRKRPTDTPVCTRRDFINTLKRELKPALAQLQASNIAPVDLAQSAIGPGMGVYSRFSKVLEADGTPMSVRSALQIINQELDLYFTEQEGELDRDSRFCVALYSQYAFNDIKFGEADVLARAKNTSVEKLAGRGVLYAQKGVVHLLTREEIPAKIDHAESIIWLLTQQLTHALITGGVAACAKIIKDIFGSGAEQAKALAYRLFTIAEHKGWAQEAYAYNSLVIAWPEIQSRVAELQAQLSNAKQTTIFDTTDKR